MVLKTIKLFVVLCCLGCTQLFAAGTSIMEYVEIGVDEEPGANGRLSPLFQISFGQTLDVRKMFVACVERIGKNECGRDLLRRLVSLIQSIHGLNGISNFGYDGRVHITFKEGEGTCFAGREYKPGKPSRFGIVPGQQMSVHLNLDFNNRSIVFAPESGLGSIIPAIKLSQNKLFCEVGLCFDPFWITVAHELIHMEHFLMQELNKCIELYIFGDCKSHAAVEAKFPTEVEIGEAARKIESLRVIVHEDVDIFARLPKPVSMETLLGYYHFLNDPKRFHARYAKNRAICDWGTIERNLTIDDFPELKARELGKRSLSFFENLEERETVVGSRCSELTIRLDEERAGNILPIRYLYQDRDTFFLERVSVILEIINKAREPLDMLPITQEHMEDKLRGKELAVFFNLGLFSHIVSSELLPD